MSSAKATVYHRGIGASPGLARGVLVRLQERVRSGMRAPSSGPTDSARLRQAIDSACTELTALKQSASDADAEAMLAFQIAMLQDPVLTDPAFAAIAGPVPPEQGWRHAMESQIRQYESTDDSYSPAQSSELRDMPYHVCTLF